MSNYRRWRQRLTRWSGRPWGWWRSRAFGSLVSSVIVVFSTMFLSLLLVVAGTMVTLASEWTGAWLDHLPAAMIFASFLPLALASLMCVLVYTLEKEKLPRHLIWIVPVLGGGLLGSLGYLALKGLLFHPLVVGLSGFSLGLLVLMTNPAFIHRMPSRGQALYRRIHRKNVSMVADFYHFEVADDPESKIRELLEQEQPEVLARTLAQMDPDGARQLSQPLVEKLLTHDYHGVREAALRLVGRKRPQTEGE